LHPVSEPKISAPAANQADGLVTAIRSVYKSHLEATMMHPSVTNNAKRNQVVHHIAAQLAPRLHVMDLQVFHGTAFLAAPTIPLQHLLPKQDVIVGI
jgi:hypothetical protein